MDDTRPLVSVIMPVYNVENYVSKAIESVLNQTLQKIEFIAVDDGSTDRSGLICDSYAETDSRLVVVHKDNAGAPTARNVALKMASGKYVSFIDSDDWIEKDMIRKMYELAEAHSADLVIEGFCMEYYLHGKDITYRTKCPDKQYSSIQDFRKDAYHYFNNSLLSLPWNKLFLLDEIRERNILFPNTKWDDHHFCMDYLMDCCNVVLSSNTDYHWFRSRRGSETMINYSDIHMFQKRKEHFEHILRLYSHWEIHDEASMDAISCYYIGRLAQCIQELANNKNISTKERKERVQFILDDSLTGEALKQSKSLSRKMKLITAPMKAKNVELSIAIGNCINIVRRIAPGLFIRMKEQEVHGA